MLYLFLKNCDWIPVVASVKLLASFKVFVNARFIPILKLSGPTSGNTYLTIGTKLVKPEVGLFTTKFLPKFPRIVFKKSLTSGPTDIDKAVSPADFLPANNAARYSK